MTGGLNRMLLEFVKTCSLKHRRFAADSRMIPIAWRCLNIMKLDAYAHEVRKPMFFLKVADGAIGAPRAPSRGVQDFHASGRAEILKEVSLQSSAG